MATADLTKQESVDTTLDNVVIPVVVEDLPGGLTVDTTGWDAETVIPAGTPVYKTGGEYYLDAPTSAAMPTGGGDEEAIGLTVASVLVSNPQVAVMVRGTINNTAKVNALNADWATQLPLIRFV